MLIGSGSQGAPDDTGLRLNGNITPAVMRVEFLRSGKESLLSMVSTVFHRASLYRPGWLGPWFYYALPFIWLALFISSAWLLISKTRKHGVEGTPNKCRRVRRTVLAIGLIAFINAATWASVMNSFHSPDEHAHYAYTELVGRHGALPDTGREGDHFTNEEGTALDSTRLFSTIFRSESHPPWSEVSLKRWKRADSKLGSRRFLGGGNPSQAANYPPLYYAYTAVPYRLAGGGDVFSKLWLIRIFSALLGAIAAAAAFLFARELIRDPPWVAVTAGLFVALQPLFSAISGSVNNDTMMTMFATLILFFVARSFRRGFSLKLAVAIGTAYGLGMIAKPTLLGLTPAIVGAVLFLAVKRPRIQGDWLRPLLVCGFVAAVPILAWYGGNFMLERPVSGFSTAQTGQPFTLGGFTSYLWQWYLPPLSYRHEWIPTGLGPFVANPSFDVWIRGFWGGFGWLDANFPEYVYRVIQVLTGFVLVALIASGIKRFSKLKQRLPELIFCVTAVIGQILFIHLTAFLALLQDGQQFAQGRYLFPLIAIFGLAVALSINVFGKRWAPVVAVVIIGSIAVLDAFAMALTLGRFYV